MIVLRSTYDNLKTDSEREIRDLRAALEHERGRAERADQERTDAYRQVCNFMAARSGLGAMFSGGDPVPERPNQGLEPIQSHVTGRDAYAAAMSKYEEEVFEFNGPATDAG